MYAKWLLMRRERDKKVLQRLQHYMERDYPWVTSRELQYYFGFDPAGPLNRLLDNGLVEVERNAGPRGAHNWRATVR